MLPPDLPIFPLPNVVLFPNVFLPLHIFEPRYRAMLADALDGDRIIGITLLRPGWDSDRTGRPPVYPVGCAGLITHTDTLADGRSHIILRGLEKFRIVDEVEPAGCPYRRARIDRIDEPLSAAVREVLGEARGRLEALLGAEAATVSASTISDADLVNALAQYLDFDAAEKQALLERDGLPARCRSLIDLLEMKQIAGRHGSSTGRAH
jgi:Lon protease-like protein